MHAFARSIVDTVRHPLVVIDSDCRVVAANAAYVRTFAGHPAGPVGRRLTDTGGPWLAPGLSPLIEGVLARDEPFQGFKIGYDDSLVGRRTLVVSGRRVTRDETDPPMVLLSIRDATDDHRDWAELSGRNADLERRVEERTAELAAANRELRAANQDLAAANRELEAFCYSVSHDLRAPLRAIDGFSNELLQRYTDRLDEKGLHYLRRVRAGTQRMAQLIDDLLNLSRVTRAEMRRERVDLTALAEAVARELQEREPGRAVAFAAEPGVAAGCDPRLIRVVLENLLGNAWKFTARNPAAAVAFGRAGAEFVVRDNGVGFDPAFAGRLFGAFQRLHPDREFPGTGVGLATVQRIIRRHGGDVRAEGAVGRGAAFYFTLPAGEEHR